MAGTGRLAANALLVFLLPVTGWLWAALVFLLQLEARNRLNGSPGESSPLYLALLGLPLVAVVSAACLAAALGRRRRNRPPDVTRALLAAGALTSLALLSLVVVPSYASAMQEFATLPWRALVGGG